MKTEINNEEDVARLIGEYSGILMGVLDTLPLADDVRARMKEKLDILRETKINFNNLANKLTNLTPDRSFAYKTALLCLEHLINTTPTSEDRNRLTEIHLLMLSLNQ